MKLLTLSCEHCKAPLEIPGGSRQVICSFCAAQLLVETTTDGPVTRVHSAPTKPTDEDPDDLRSQLEQLDSDWLYRREHYRVPGTPFIDVPDTGRAIALGMTIIVLGVMFTIVAAVTAPLSVSAPIGVVFLSIAVYFLVKGVSRAQLYEEAYNDYRDQRIDVLRQIFR